MIQNRDEYRLYAGKLDGRAEYNVLEITESIINKVVSRYDIFYGT